MQVSEGLIESITKSEEQYLLDRLSTDVLWWDPHTLKPSPLYTVDARDLCRAVLFGRQQLEGVLCKGGHGDKLTCDVRGTYLQKTRSWCASDYYTGRELDRSLEWFSGIEKEMRLRAAFMEHE